MGSSRLAPPVETAKETAAIEALESQIGSSQAKEATLASG